MNDGNKGVEENFGPVAQETPDKSKEEYIKEIITGQTEKLAEKRKGEMESAEVVGSQTYSDIKSKRIENIKGKTPGTPAYISEKQNPDPRDENQ